MRRLAMIMAGSAVLVFAVGAILGPGGGARAAEGRLLTVDDQFEIRDVGDPQISVSFIGSATPSNPAPIPPELMDTVETLTRSMFPGVVVVPVMSTGATDGLYLRNAGIPTYGVDATFADVDDVRAHGRDERIGVKQYFEGLEFQYRLIKMLSSH